MILHLPNAWEALGTPTLVLDLDTAPGRRVAILKNSKQVITKPFPRITSSKAHKRFARWVRGELPRWLRPWRQLATDVPLLVSVVYEPANRVGHPDLDGVVSTALDTLQDYKVRRRGLEVTVPGFYADDRQVRRTDFSEILQPNKERPRLWVWIRALEMDSEARAWRVIEPMGGRTGRPEASGAGT